MNLDKTWGFWDKFVKLQQAIGLTVVNDTPDYSFPINSLSHMDYKFPIFYATQFAPFKKKRFELVFRLLQKDSLNKKWSFPLRISPVSVTKSAIFCGFGHIYWKNP